MRRTAAVLLLLLSALPASAQVTILDVIPSSMTNETFSDSEPFLTFNPANPQVLVISAAETANMGSTNGPLLVSLDGGANWIRRDIVPTCSGCLNTGDITIGFTSSGRLVAGILSNAPGGGMKILHTTDAMLNTAMTPIGGPAAGRDQPYLTDRTVFGWFDPGNDRAYVGNNGYLLGNPTARIDHTLDAGAMAPVVTVSSIDTRMPVVFDNYQIRPVIAADGTLYAAYIRRTGNTANGYNADIILLRDNHWAKTAPLYDDLSGTNGVLVASVEITDTSGANTYGGERIGGDMAIAVDPRDAQTVYLSYAARTSAADPMTLHLRQSTNGGTMFGADMLTIANAKNGSVAVNSQGHVAYLYQQLTGMMGSRHWVTHLRRFDGMAWNDLTLSDFPGEGAGAPPRNLSVYVADYERVINIGKNFYGVFTASNDPATFPSGINYLRNISGGILRQDDGVTPVATSLDPIFFRTTEVAPDTDVYVRDWTDSASVRDHGLEPSSHIDFFHTSDVWNRRTNDPQPFDANDRPQSEDPRPAAFGHNWAFTRVSREATGSPQTVTVEFLFSDGGVGTNYVSAGSTSLMLGGGADRANLTAGNGLQWDLPSGASNHVCLATQISIPGVDPYLGATLAGRSPGWPQLDLEILNDNNKAQRNMQVYSGMGQAIQDWTMLAVIHNQATRTRDMEIGIDYDARVLRPKIRFLGGTETAQPSDIAPHSSVTLKGMRPGENRWIEVTAAGSAPKEDAVMHIYELVGQQPVNGYSFVFRSAIELEVIGRNIVQHGAVVARLAALGQRDMEREVRHTKTLLLAKDIPGDVYMRFAKESMRALRRGIALPKYPAVPDPFSIPTAIDELLRIDDLPRFAAAHLSLLNRIDALVSMTRKKRGDLADVHQLDALQRRLAERDGIQGKDVLSDAVQRSGDEILRAKYELLARAKDAESAEGARRDFLLRWEELKAPASAEEMIDHSGDSPQTAISVPADAPEGGIPFENQWIFDQYGKFTKDGGGTGTMEGRRYNVVKITLANGEKKTVYFDITELWAKSLKQ